MTPTLTKRVANAWRSFFTSFEGQEGLAYILANRPALDEKNWQRAAGFEEFQRRINEILEHDLARISKEDDEDRLKS